jgi:cytochrome c oxidase cbb3-type subunit 3
MARAAEIWDRKCLACHGARGGGGVGPNLTDRYWLHGGSPQEIRRSIAKGFPMQGMIAYEDDLSPAEIDALVDYILEMQGTDPPNAIPPQGEPVE